MNLKIGVLATIAALLLVAGCSKMVDGRAIISAPRPGSPIQWAPCKAASSDATRLPAGAECGMLSVPVDYSKPDGDVAQIAMIRFKATGQKIGSLVINPGGPGESGVDPRLDFHCCRSCRRRHDDVHKGTSSTIDVAIHCRHVPRCTAVRCPIRMA